MFETPIRKFQLELIKYLIYFSTVVPPNSSVFLSGKKHTTVGWGDGEKIGKIIN